MMPTATVPAGGGEKQAALAPAAGDGWCEAGAGAIVTDEARLVGRLKAREPLALEDLYDRFGPLVYSVALRLVRDAAAAEDVTQETFLCIWNRVRTFDASRGTLAGWVCAVARSRALDYLRSAQFRMARSSAPLEEAKPCVDPLATRGASHLESRWLLEGPWMQLKEHERQTLRLAHWWGLSQAEIAERLNRPLGTVKTWTRRGHQSLRAALEGGHAH